MDKLGDLGRQIEALKAKRANNSMVASQAEDTAISAQNKANEAKQVHDNATHFTFLSWLFFQLDFLSD